MSNLKDFFEIKQGEFGYIGENELEESQVETYESDNKIYGAVAYKDLGKTVEIVSIAVSRYAKDKFQTAETLIITVLDNTTAERYLFEMRNTQQNSKLGERLKWDKEEKEMITTWILEG